MAKKITVHYTLETRCQRSIEVEDDFQIDSNNSIELTKELIQKCPSLELDDLDEYWDESEFISHDFQGIDGMEVIDSSRKINSFYPDRKE